MSSTSPLTTDDTDRNGAPPAGDAPPAAAEADLIARQRALLRDLAGLCRRRVRGVPEIEAAYKQAVAAATHAFEEDYQTAIVRFAGAKERLDEEHRERTAAANARAEEEQAAAEADLDSTRRRVLARYAREKHDQRHAYKETSWTINSVQDAARADTEKHFQDVQQQAEVQMRQLRAMHGEARELLERWGLRPPEAEPRVPPPGGKFRKLPFCVQAAEWHLGQLKELSAPAWARGVKLPLIFAVLTLALAVAAGFLTSNWLLAVAVAAAVALLGAVVTFTVKSVARNQALALYGPVSQAMADAELSEKHIREHYAARLQQQLQAIRQKREAELRQAQRKYKKQRALSKRKRTARLAKMRARYKRRRDKAARQQQEALQQADDHYRQTLAGLQSRYEAESKAAHEQHDRQRVAVREQYERERHDLAGVWEEGMARAGAAVAAILDETGRLFRPWDDPGWARWAPPAALPPVLRFGAYRVGLEQIAGRPLTVERTVASLPDFTLPALCPFPEGCSLLVQASDAGRAEAVRALQAVMYRLLTAVPPGKVRFTILDPVGLGQNFAAFMHLADYQEALVGSRIWTEQTHIEQRLADLTAHMENIIQKYLRNHFRTIEEYNAYAGEVAEPFRVLVVANFPANFSAEAARRLVSIAQSGPRCGVHTLITVDTRQPLPQGFALADLEGVSVNLHWQAPPAAEGAGPARPPCFVWDDEDFSKFPLALDVTPPDDLAMRLLQAVGEKARDANRVEVPFEFIAPAPAEWWTGDSRSGLAVALGRAGATKRQHLRLGSGTSQHVLVAGKTGSGKSTLLHALITNLALLYSPAEVELYLVDFKKGVEFKTYAAHDLPHARVIAIESEREFGLSVLQRLDAELRVRGDRFRAAGAQDLASYRNETGEVLPRILLIVDEFQEFFVEDDRVSQDAAQLLDRLVRQGRAFGLHVLLGSQTLGGAYTLARSTIDQMAVRIALQCSEADAHLILSDGNSAARLLSRPGEAIYNDANGLVEGNNPFQVVWLPEERREKYLEAVQALYRERQPAPAPPALVFEGNVPADPAKNHLLAGLLAAPSWDVPPRAVLAWMGEPMTIKDPTAATFRPQSASNLLIVGQQDDAALAILTTGLASLAAQVPPGSAPQFHVVDGSPVDAPFAGYLNRVAESLPGRVRLAGWRDLPAVLNELSEELKRRQQATDAPQFAPVFLFLFGLQRFRDLRRSEDDFGFGRREEKATPQQQFADLLREGPGLGLHVVVWCDTLNNLNRSLDRQGLREFDLRVLFQMSVADSSNLMDTPLAAKLGLHRAYFYSEEQGRAEKFRPYGLPPEAWLARVGEQLRGRTAETAR